MNSAPTNRMLHTRQTKGLCYNKVWNNSKNKGRFIHQIVLGSVAVPQQYKMMTFEYKDYTQQELKQKIARPRQDFQQILQKVSPIVESVRERGDEAVKEYTNMFDKVDVQRPCIPLEDFEPPELPRDVTEAFDVAYNNIYKFHNAQLKQELVVETMPGVVCRRVPRPIGAIGIYVPGGSAILPSSALMLSIPAQIAGCKTVVLATPPTKHGSLCPEVLYCAKKAGVTHILLAGGAQAVAAMAWGTETCPKVDKILGPGNQYVTAAKMVLQNSEAMISIDMPAGPSEVLVIADGGADPSHVAADLLSQAEHGPDSQVVLVALPDVNLEKIYEQVEQQCNALPRSEITKQALSHSFVIKVGSKEEAIAVSNLYAPEHLIVNVEDAESMLDDIDNSGSVFLGRWTPESVGDFASGTNHVLPTYGYARMYSGVSLDSFQKMMTVQSLTKEGLENVGKSVVKMAEVEKLDAHRRAVTLRLGLGD
eukprot:TRINITY_DN23494_c0_g1_i4.p2 TRINITY_DN23494_c0_g1~~TRINITY_DN23494_c0_g1_i4.p2  ORF type:complete len:479 (-),score=66.50 TRINITY_DN23494_c0_g1_i4:201-1637(-)